MPEFDPTGASRAVLIEVMNVLGAFRGDIVLIGGWVPDLLYPNRGHMGSLDVDLAVSPEAFRPAVYQTILTRMLNAGYTHRAAPTHFLKQIEGTPHPVKVDLISGAYQGEERGKTIQVNELQLNTLRGLDLAFELCEEMQISGIMPDGIRNTVRVRIVRPEAFILIKAFALEERQVEKDAYDIDFVLRNYEPDVDALARRMAQLVAGGLAKEGYETLKAKFATLDAVGPCWAARVAQEQGADYAQAQRAAFEYAQTLFRATA